MRTSLRGRGSRSPVRPGWAVQEGRGGSSGAEQLLGAWLESRDLGMVREAAQQNKHLL